MVPLTDDVRSLLEAPNMVHLATLLPDGSPHSVTIWAGVEGDRIAFFTQRSSQKGRNLAADPRLALSVVDRRNPYRTARVRGRVVETIDAPDSLEIVDRIAHVYTGAAFPMRTVTAYLVEPEQVGFTELPFRDEPPAA
jgi:PPOX class probable F420-dependent enzyme